MSRLPLGDAARPAPLSALLGAAVLAAPVALLTVDPQGVVLSFNQAAERALGFREAELAGLSLDEIAAPEDVLAQRGALARALAGEELTLRALWRRRDGFVHARVSLAPIRDIEGLAIGVVLALAVEESADASDGTESGPVRRAREAGEDAEQPGALATSALEILPDAVLIASLVGTTLRSPFANRHACALFGWREPPTAEAPAVVALDGDPLAGAIAALIATSAREQELVVRRADGREGRLLVQLSPFGPADGGVSLVCARDVTQMRGREDARVQAEKMDAVGRLAGGVAHEFNNMLTAIGGFGDLLLEDLAESDPKRGDVLQIKEAAERATALTRELLAFSARQVLQPHSVDLVALVTAAAPRLRATVGVLSELVLDLPDTPTFVHADATQLDHVLDHLVANARDAMPEGGRVTISTRHLATDLQRPSQFPAGPQVVLSVADTGVGMDSVAASKAFEPFFTTKVSRSGGLGLSSVYGIIRQSGGHIQVDSAVGEGATFRVHLPSTVAPHLVATRPPTLVAPRLLETILLLEDEEVVRTLAAHVLRRHGYRVIEAADGEEGLACSASFGGAIDLLLTDVVMPRRGGLEVARRLCAERTTLRVLFMSGFTEDSDILRGLRDDQLAFLPKPFTPDALLRRVRQVLDDETDGPVTSRSWVVRADAM